MDPLALVALGGRTGVGLAAGYAVIEITRECVVPALQEAWRWIMSKLSTIPQCVFIEGVPEVGDTVYRQQVLRRSNKPYKFKYSHPTEFITGIACVPLNDKVQSPETEIVTGGINFKEVVICLTPVKEGDWGCSVAICGSKKDPGERRSSSSSDLAIFNARPAGNPAQRLFQLPAP